MPVVFASTTTLSCGNGTREVHFVTSDQLPPALAVCVCVVAPSNVISVFPSASPIDEPVNGVPAPAAVMSVQSAFALVVELDAVTVRAVPTVEDCTSTRLIALLPVTVNAPVQVTAPVRESTSVLTAVPVRVSAAKLFAPVNVPVIVVVPAPLSVTPNPPAVNAPDVSVSAVPELVNASPSVTFTIVRLPMVFPAVVSVPAARIESADVAALLSVYVEPAENVTDPEIESVTAAVCVSVPP